MRGEFVDLAGARLYCYAFGTRGAGDPLVLVHGAFLSSHVWQDLLPRLPQGHRVLVLDLLGHGRSDPARDQAMTVAGHADRLQALLDAMGIAACTLVGHGFGAAVAARVAHADPARIRQLVLVNPTLLARTPTAAFVLPRFRRLAWGIPLWRQLSGGWLASQLHAALLRGFAHREAGARSLDLCLKSFRTRAGRDSACAQLAALKESTDDTVEALAPGALPMPTALVFGQLDPFVTSRRSATLTGDVQAATDQRVQVHVLPGVSHVAPLEAPDRLGTIIADLIGEGTVPDIPPLQLDRQPTVP